MTGSRVKFGLTLPNRGVVIGATTVAKIESLGGRLWANPNTGRGATFQFTLPNEVMVSSPKIV